MRRQSAQSSRFLVQRSVSYPGLMGSNSNLPPHCPNCVCVGPEAVVVVELPVFELVVVVATVVVVVFAVVEAGGPKSLVSSACPHDHCKYCLMLQGRHLLSGSTMVSQVMYLYYEPWFPHPVLGQSGAFSPSMQAPSQRGPPSDPDHWLQLTSLQVPTRAPWPDGKNTPDPPVSSQISKLANISTDILTIPKSH